MLREPKTITVDPDSELGHLLEQATKSPLILEMNGVRYLVSPESERWPEISDEEYQRILDATIGTLPDEEAERMLATISRARGEGAQPVDHP
jgi:hypothetical protein